MSEDPVKRAAAEERERRKAFIKANLPENIEKFTTDHPLYGRSLSLIRRGIALDSFTFTPSEEYPDIDQYIGNL